MNIYLVTIDGEIGRCYTTLRALCTDYGLSYDSALNGKRCWEKDGSIYVIYPKEVVKVRGRGKHF